MDTELAPPIVKKPIYNCAKIIAFTGAERDSQIIVYVNGNKVVEKNTWMGWGHIILPDPLVNGDTVSVAQKKDENLSWKTRDPVTVEIIPEDLAPERKLNPPEIIPPLYECQKLVRLKNIVEGTTVVLRDKNARTWRAMTPYDNIGIRTSKLEYPNWCNAFQRICEDQPYTSDWSKKENVLQKPTFLPEADVREPIYHGNDACVVDNLIPGAEVDIFANDNGDSTLVGEGIAAGSSTIFRIDPPLDKEKKYHAIQSLCETYSKIPLNLPSPIENLPPPTVKGPICNGDYYVKICNTVIMSSVKVYINGKQVSQAAGNGDCITIALSDKISFASGDKVTAKQYVAGRPSHLSAAEIVQISGDPVYDPAYWNDSFHIVRNNCYAYACDIRGETKYPTKQQPGLAHGKMFSKLNCSDVGKAAKADNLIEQPEQECSGCTHLVALVIAPGRDYHWYRLDRNGHWSHKPGWTEATDRDASDKPITSPETADRKYAGKDYVLDYDTFCTYFCVDKKFVKIK
jgi:hypothetical protein